MVAKLKFLEGGGGGEDAKQNTLGGEGMDVFCNHTIHEGNTMF